MEAFSNSNSRKILFDGYKKFCEDLKLVVGSHQQWIDGSFVTSKKNPNDIDILCFVPTTKLRPNERSVLNLLESSKELYGVDAYVIEVLDSNDSQHKIYEHNKVYWLNQFTKTKKMGHRKVQYDKGFLQLWIG
ncbi:hypothetical protein GGR27_001186 [Lewinella antarctica]|uniref:Polymerase nucleotidyl transferase domain-containing protein n=1 Tax=Neolewinella antarctica TaxID=442734 RepID=A0ABX0X927_9BACT|nr:hypothetical protein [Neolewinella antarctica]